MRVLAIDYGEQRTGVAISDLLNTMAGQAFVLKTKPKHALLQEIAKLCNENQIDTIALGLPKNMDGTLGERAQLSQAFSEEIKTATGITASFIDERLTTVNASRLLHSAGKNTRKQKGSIDAVAAALILETFLSQNRQKT